MEEQMYKLILVGLVLLFTFAVICRSIYVLIKRGKVFGESSTKLIGLTVVVFSVPLSLDRNDRKKTKTTNKNAIVYNSANLQSVRIASLGRKDEYPFYPASQSGCILTGCRGAWCDGCFYRAMHPEWDAGR